MYFIGVDLGTSAVKLLLMDEEGKIINIVSREYPLYFPHPGWSEQKPEDWWEQSKEGIRELVKDVDKSQVAGISFGGQMHGLVILDENGCVVIKADIGSVASSRGLNGSHDDCLNDIALLCNSARSCLLYGADDNIAHARIASAGAAKNSDAQQFFCAGVVSDLQTGLLL